MLGTNIYFADLSTLQEDETQFDTTDKAELQELWWDFCIENGIISGVEEVEVID